MILVFGSAGATLVCGKKPYPENVLKAEFDYINTNPFIDDVGGQIVRTPNDGDSPIISETREIISHELGRSKRYARLFE